jgi:type I restriction enzyme S subunit
LCHIWLSFILAYIYKKVEKGNFVISLRSFQGGIEYSEYEGLISPAYTVLGSKVEICDDYYKSYLKSPDYIQRLNTAVYGIRDGKNISYDDFSLIYIPFPPLPEQQKIAEILSTQDKLIELQEKKIEKLKELKKAYLQKMFPKKGSKYPELRFKGFTDPWEQRKVTKLGEIYIGLVTTMTSHYTDHGALLIRNSDIKDSRFEFGTEPIYLDDDFAKQNASRQHKVGDVITVHTGDIGTSAVITEKEANSIGFATIVTRPYKDIITSDYLCTYLNTDTHKNFAMNISTGDGRNNYNLKDYYECVVPVPCIEEQKRISEFIKNLNNLITLHQRKSEQEKQKKKALMQLLLTGIVRTK